MSDETTFIIVLFTSLAFALGLCIWGLRKENREITELAVKANIDWDLASFIYRIYGKSALDADPEFLEGVICRLTDKVAELKWRRYLNDPTEINNYKTIFECDAMFKRIGKGNSVYHINCKI